MSLPAWSELAGSPRWQIDILRKGVFEGTRDVLVNWADTWDYCDAILSPGNNIWPSAYGNVPQARAYRTQVEWLRREACLDTGDAKHATYQKAIVHVYYTTELFDYNNIVARESIAPAAKSRALPNELFAWASDSAPVTQDEAPVLVEPGFTYVLQFFRAPAIPAAVLTLEKSVNATAFSVPGAPMGLVFAPETLLFSHWSASCNVRPGHLNTFDVAYTFGHQRGADSAGVPCGWNGYWRADRLSYERLLTPDGSVYFQHPLANLSLLFP